MKRRMIQRSLVVAVFAAIALTVNAQQEHQTYNGTFGRGNAGTATYSYYMVWDYNVDLQDFTYTATEK
jgi:hypothetical protein